VSLVENQRDPVRADGILEKVTGMWSSRDLQDRARGFLDGFRSRRNVVGDGTPSDGRAAREQTVVCFETALLLGSRVTVIGEIRLGESGNLVLGPVSADSAEGLLPSVSSSYHADQDQLASSIGGFVLISDSPAYQSAQDGWFGGKWFSWLDAAGTAGVSEEGDAGKQC